MDWSSTEIHWCSLEGFVYLFITLFIYLFHIVITALSKKKKKKGILNVLSVTEQMDVFVGGSWLPHL